MTVSSRTRRSSNTRTSAQRARQQQQREKAKTHTVKKGESLWSISQQRSAGRTNAEVSRYHQDLIRANPQIKDPNVIRPGQELNLPEQPTTGTSRLKPTTTDASRYEPSSSAPEPQTARPDPNAANATHPPISQELSDEVTSRRTNANTNTNTSAGRTRGGRRPAEEDEDNTQASGKSRGASAGETESKGRAPSFSRRAMPYMNGYGNVDHRSFSREGSEGGTLRQHSQRERTENRGREQWRDTNSETVETTANGQRTHQLRQDNELRNRRTGQAEGESTTVAQDERGNFGSRTTNTSVDDDDKSAMERLMELNGPRAVKATAVLAEHRIAGDDDWHGVKTVDNRHTEDRTGAGYEAHALAYRANADAGASIDLRHGELNVGAGGRVQADLAGASASAQLGTRDSLRGALRGEAEANVGARGDIGANATISRDNVGVRAGGEVFAGAEIRGTAGYDNRYGGVSVTGRAQAGAGAAAAVDVGYRNGVVGVQADLGAAVGLGGRVTLDVNVNVGAIAQDTGKVVGAIAQDTGKVVGAIAQDAGKAVENVADNVREGATRAWSAINPFD